MDCGMSFFRVLLAGSLLAAILTCTREDEAIRLEQPQNGTLCLAHQVISLEVLPSTRLVVSYQSDNGEKLSLVAADPDYAPVTHFPTVDGQAVDQFVLQPESVRFETIRDVYGKGKELDVRALAQGPQNSLI